MVLTIIISITRYCPHHWRLYEHASCLHAKMRAMRGTWPSLARLDRGLLREAHGRPCVHFTVVRGASCGRLGAQLPQLCAEYLQLARLVRQLRSSMQSCCSRAGGTRMPPAGALAVSSA